MDTTKIENFENMTAEEKVEALLKLGSETENANATNEQKYKELISKANSEAAAYKKAARENEEKLKAKLSDEEKAQLAAKEAEEKRIAEFNALEEKYNEIVKKNEITEKAYHYQKLGYSDELAKATAEAFINGDNATVEANELKYREELEKTIRAEIVKGNPKPNDNGMRATVTRDDIMGKKSYAERLRMAEQNIEVLKEN